MSWQLHNFWPTTEPFWFDDWDLHNALNCITTQRHHCFGSNSDSISAHSNRCINTTQPSTYLATQLTRITNTIIGAIIHMKLSWATVIDVHRISSPRNVVIGFKRSLLLPSVGMVTMSRHGSSSRHATNHSRRLSSWCCNVRRLRRWVTGHGIGSTGCCGIHRCTTWQPHQKLPTSHFTFNR